MKKILFVITKSNWGGAQRYVYDLATHLPKEEFDVAVAFGQPGLLAKKLAEAGIKTHVLASMQRDVSIGSDLRTTAELYRLFKKEKPDVVHLNSSKAGGVGALAARLAGVPHIIFTAHGWPFWEQRTILSRILIYTFSWLTALLSHKIIAVSDFDLSVAKKMPFIKNKIIRIHNGIEPLQLESGDSIRSSFPSGAKITGTIGELTKNKNQIALIEQAKKDPNMYVAIVGEGELRSFLENKIREYNLQDRVKLFGFHPASDVLPGFDTFALPSLKEGLPYVLLEAKMAGIPIVANPVGGIPEILNGKIEDFTLEKMVEETKKLY
jgi:glycosyltransferase involved in cell wall biosynthesis